MDAACRRCDAPDALRAPVPLTAIFGAWLGDHPVTVYGLGALGPFFAPSDFGQVLADIHGLLGDAIFWLAGLHAGAALFHHFVLRDRVLKTMLPCKVSAQEISKPS